MSSQLPDALKSLERLNEKIVDRFTYLAQRSTAPGAWHAALLEVNQLFEEAPVAQALQPKPGEVVVRLDRSKTEHLFERCTESTNAPKINGYSCEDCREIGEALRSALEQSS